MKENANGRMPSSAPPSSPSLKTSPDKHSVPFRHVTRDATSRERGLSMYSPIASRALENPLSSRSAAAKPPPRRNLHAQHTADSSLMGGLATTSSLYRPIEAAAAATALDQPPPEPLRRHVDSPRPAPLREPNPFPPENLQSQAFYASIAVPTYSNVTQGSRDTVSYMVVFTALDARKHCVLRSYADFAKLHAVLVRVYTESAIPRLPKKSSLGLLQRQDTQAMIEKRGEKLAKYLHGLANLSNLDLIPEVISFFATKLDAVSVPPAKMSGGSGAAAAGGNPTTAAVPQLVKPSAGGDVASAPSKKSFSVVLHHHILGGGAAVKEQQPPPPPQHSRSHRRNQLVAMATIGRQTPAPLASSASMASSTGDALVVPDRLQGGGGGPQDDPVPPPLRWLKIIFSKLHERLQAIVTVEEFIVYHTFSKMAIRATTFFTDAKLVEAPAPLEEDPADASDEEGSPSPSLLHQKRLRALLSRLLDSIGDILNALERMRMDFMQPDGDSAHLRFCEGFVAKLVATVVEATAIITAEEGYRIDGGVADGTASPVAGLDFFPFNTYRFANEFSRCADAFVFTHLGTRGSGPLIVVAKPIRSYPPTRFAAYICSRDGNAFETFNVKNGGGGSAATAVATSSNVVPVVTALPPGTPRHVVIRSRAFEVIAAHFSHLSHVEWGVCSVMAAKEPLLEHERRDLRISRQFKFGVLLCRPGQTSEEAMFANRSTPAFEAFLDVLGERIPLAGYTGFAGGLDTRGTNTTGTEAVRASTLAADGQSIDMLFHVATLLPFAETDQLIAKKRHIGNDIVVIIFQEEDSAAYLPSTIKSNYIQVLIVVRAITLGHASWAYQVSVATAADVPDFGPVLPFPPVWTDRDQLRDWLHRKLINGELASYRSKLFVQQFRMTFKAMVEDLAEKIAPCAAPIAAKKKKWILG